MSSPNGVRVAERPHVPRRCRSSGSARARADSERRPRARPRSRAAPAGGQSPPAARSASRNVAAASAEPPPIPPATGTCLAISIRTGGPSQPVAARKRASARAARFSPVDAGADDLVAGPGGGAELELVGERHRLDERDQRVVAVGARAADEQAQVDLAGREAAQRFIAPARGEHAPLVASAIESAPRAALASRSGASCSARAFAGRPIAASAARARSRTSGSAPDARLSERASALRRCANPVAGRARAARARARGRGGSAPPARSPRSARDERRYARRGAARGRRRRAGPAPTARRRPAYRAARRSAPRPPSAPSRPSVVTAGSSEIVRRITVAATP